MTAEWLAFSIPGGVLLIMGLAAYELHPSRRKRRSGTPLSATTINEVTALFHGTKRVELDHRDSMSMMREEDADGAPKRMGIDLEHNTVTLRPDDPLVG